MFGQLIFAELPFASIGQPPYLEHGWIKDCAKPTGWEKQDKEYLVKKLCQPFCVSINLQLPTIHELVSLVDAGQADAARLTPSRNVQWQVGAELA